MLKRSWQFWCRVFDQFYRGGFLNRSASLAYTTLLSLVPLLTVSFSVLTAFPVFKGLAQKMQGFIFDNFVANSAQTVQLQLQEFIKQTAKLPVLGLLGLVVTAVLLVFSIEQAFNTVWQVKRRREDVSAFLIYWGVITFVPILIGVGLTVITSLLALPFFEISATTHGFKEVILFVFPYILTYLVFAVLYRALPNCKVPLRSALLAALPATILFELAKQCFTAYIANFPTYTLIYGALATVPIFLIWLYVSWVVILFGAVISYVLTGSTGSVIQKSQKLA